MTFNIAQTHLKKLFYFSFQYFNEGFSDIESSTKPSQGMNYSLTF